MSEDNLESSNINFKWLNLIYTQLENIQIMERLAREGCESLVEYLQIPYEARRIVIPDTQYKNLKFMVMELDILISNLAPIIKDKTKEYKNKLSSVMAIIDKRDMFLTESKQNNNLIGYETLELLTKTVEYLSAIKSEILMEIGDVLYIKDEVKGNKW